MAGTRASANKGTKGTLTLRMGAKVNIERENTLSLLDAQLIEVSCKCFFRY